VPLKVTYSPTHAATPCFPLFPSAFFSNLVRGGGMWAHADLTGAAGSPPGTSTSLTQLVRVGCLRVPHQTNFKQLEQRERRLG